MESYRVMLDIPRKPTQTLWHHIWHPVKATIQLKEPYIQYRQVCSQTVEDIMPKHIFSISNINTGKN